MSKFKKFTLNVVKLATSVFIVSFLTIILMTIGEFISIDLHLSESQFGYVVLYYLLPFLSFVLCIVLLMKSKTIKPFVIMLLLIGILYFTGKLYAQKIIKPFQLAAQYITEAESKNDWKNATDTKLYIEGEAEYVALYEKASLQNFGYEIWIKKHYEDWYKFKKELYEMDKQLFSGQLVLTKEQSDKILEEYNKRAEALNLMVAGPFWMGFYNVSY
jgi:uncharacterized membrane protein YgdD (TMEM256/DUF423 family)